MTLEDKVDGLVVTVEKLAGAMQDGFESINKKIDSGFARAEDKFSGVGQQFEFLAERIDKRIDGLESTMNHRFDEVGSRLTSVEGRTRALELKRS